MDSVDQVWMRQTNESLRRVIVSRNNLGDDHDVKLAAVAALNLVGWVLAKASPSVRTDVLALMPVSVPQYIDAYQKGKGGPDAT